MRKLQLLSMALVLTLALATGAFGGIIDGPPAPAPPPPPDSTASSTMASVVLTLIQTALSVR